MNTENIYPLTIFHDGDCPICRFEVANLQHHNQANTLQFIDITSPGFNPAHYGMTHEDFSAQIQAQCADGTFVSGVKVFQLAYRAVGLGWVVAPTHWKALAYPTHLLYRLFARNRNGIGRHFGWFFEYLTARITEKNIRQCRTESCSINPTAPAASAKAKYPKH